MRLVDLELGDRITRSGFVASWRGSCENNDDYSMGAVLQAMR